MKKVCSLFLAMILLLFVSGCNAQEPEKTEDDGKVAVWIPKESVTYNEDGGIWASESKVYDANARCLTTTTYSDEKEMERSEFYFREDGKIDKVVGFYYGEKQHEEKYQYDENLNLLEKVYYVHEELNERYCYEYDQSNRVVGGSVYMKTFQQEYSFENQYNDAGEVAEYIRYEDGKEVSRTLYQYDADGNEIEAVVYVDGVEEQITTSKYDDRGNLIEKTKSEYGVVTDRMVYHFNADGNLMEEHVSIYENGVETNQSVYQYNEKGNMTSCIIYNDGQEIYRSLTDYEYDAQGRMLASYDNGNDTPSVKYSYDEYGNLTERKEYKNGQLEFRSVTKYEKIRLSPEMKEMWEVMYLLSAN